MPRPVLPRPVLPRLASLPLISALLCCLLIAPAATAQEAPPVEATWEKQAKQLSLLDGSVVSNFIQLLEAQGDSLWFGPLLSVYVEDAPEGERFQTADRPELLEDENVVFALDVEGTPGSSVIWSGLAFAGRDGQAAAGGFLISQDGGQSFVARPSQLDGPAETSVSYGLTTIEAVPITQAGGAAPQALDGAGQTGPVWLAGARSGLRVTTDEGETWQRVVLPPDTARQVRPDEPNDFILAPPLDDGRGNRNHFVFSVLVDETGTVWAGTAAGVNRSTPDDVIGGDRAWTHFIADGTRGTLTGNSVVNVEEQPLPGRNPVWLATWALDPTDRFGVTVTTDGGETFRQTLVGERVYDFAFDGERVYAASDAGLFFSDDGGFTWLSLTDFEVEGDTVLPPDLGVRAVAVTRSALWVGTTDGLLRSTNGGQTWQAFRTRAPVNPDSSSDAVPDVATYAYPNPFSPASDRLVRIVYEVEQSASATIQIFDFRMNLVRTLRDDVGSGEVETVWDGTDESGLRLPNGPYFYTVEAGGTSARGKILLVE